MSLNRSSPEVPNRENLRDLARWLILVPMVILILFACGFMATLGLGFPSPDGNFDARSKMRADYSIWDYMVVHPVSAAILDEIIQGMESPPEELVIPGYFWPGATATPIPSPTPTGTSIATTTATQTVQPTLTPTTSATATGTPTQKPTQTATSTATYRPPIRYYPTSTRTHTPDPTNTATDLPSATSSPSVTPSSTQAASHTPTITPSLTVTATGTPATPDTATPTPTSTSTPLPTCAPPVPIDGELPDGYVQGVDPDDGEIDVSITRDTIYIFYNQPMKNDGSGGSVERPEHYRLRNLNTNNDVTILDMNYDPFTWLLTIIFDNTDLDWDYSTPYEVSVQASAMNVCGNPQGGTVSTTFTTESIPTPTPTTTSTPGSTPTLTSTSTPSVTSTFTPTPTSTNTATSTPTPTATSSPTRTSTSSPTPTNTATPTRTSTPTPTPTSTPILCGGNFPSGEPDIGPPDGNYATYACGSVWTIDLVANGYPSIDTTLPDSNFDIVYYERELPPPPFNYIAFDWVTLQVGTGPTGSCSSGEWFTAMNWGDGNPSNNGHLGGSYPEIDNQQIPYSSLYGAPPLQTGIAIDLDALGLSDIYPCIRIYSPINWPDNDGSEADAIQILP